MTGCVCSRAQHDLWPFAVRLASLVCRELIVTASRARFLRSSLYAQSYAMPLHSATKIGAGIGLVLGLMVCVPVAWAGPLAGEPFWRSAACYAIGLLAAVAAGAAGPWWLDGARSANDGHALQHTSAVMVSMVISGGSTGLLELIGPELADRSIMRIAAGSIPIGWVGYLGAVLIFALIMRLFGYTVDMASQWTPSRDLNAPLPHGRIIRVADGSAAQQVITSLVAVIVVLLNWLIDLPLRPHI
jgi:hypothetical protein